MAKRVKAAAAPSKVQTTDDLVTALARLTELDAQRESAIAEVDVKYTAIKLGLALVLTTIKAEEAALNKDIQRYAEVNRAELTDDGRVKTAYFATGDVGWRNDPPSVSLPRDPALQASIVEALAAIDEALVRVTRAVDKEAILAVQRQFESTPVASLESVRLSGLLVLIESIPGLKINTDIEQFFIRPKGIAQPEHAGAPADAATEAVAA